MTINNTSPYCSCFFRNKKKQASSYAHKSLFLGPEEEPGQSQDNQLLREFGKHWHYRFPPSSHSSSQMTPCKIYIFSQGT
mmetsp:Transcript_37149/g.62486  ORF Transcript_37149/g.62486 Transcript_37149/m.62486 type:complete len:80 (+) Transcript_37149:1179-1418(+)